MNGELELRQVELAVAVADHGGAGPAAAVLGARPDVVQAQLMRIERVLGAELFAVEQGVFVPTPTGRRVLQAARATLDAAEALRAEIARMRDPATTVRVRASLLPFEAFVPFLERGTPDVEWTVQGARSTAGMEAVADRTADLFLGPTSAGDTGFVLPQGLVAHHVLAEPVRLVLPRTHPRAGDAVVPLAALSTSSWAVPAEPAAERHLRAACVSTGFEPDVPFRPEDLQIVVEMVANGFAVAALPATAVSDERVVLRECPDLPSLDWTLVHRPDGVAQDVVRTVVETLRLVYAARAAQVPGLAAALPPELGGAGIAAEPLGTPGRPVRFASVAHPAVPPALTAVADRAVVVPHAVVTRERPDALMEAVRRGEVDIAMSQDHPYSWGEPAVGVAQRTIVAAEPLFVAVGPRHPLAERAAVTAAEAGKLEWADAPVDPARPSTTAAFWTAVGQDPPVTHRFVDPGSAVDLLVDNDVMAMAVATSLEPRLRYVRLDHPLAFRRLFLLWRPDRVPAAVVDALGGELQEQMRALLPRMPHLRRWLDEHPGAMPELA